MWPPGRDSGRTGMLPKNGYRTIAPSAVYRSQIKRREVWAIREAVEAERLRRARGASPPVVPNRPLFEAFPPRQRLG
jgi:hypothetical protein